MPDLNCGTCLKLVRDGVRQAPLCHSRPCSVSHVMLPDYEIWLSFLFKLKSEIIASGDTAEVWRRARVFDGDAIGYLAHFDNLRSQIQHEKTMKDAEARRSGY